MPDEVAFGSMEWLDAYTKMYNERPEIQESLKDLTAHVAYEFTDRPDIPPKYVYIKEGVVAENGVMSYPGSMVYIIRANYSVWKLMTLFELDPMNALMAGKIKVTGNMAALLKHADGFKQTFEVVEAMPTTYD